MQIFLLYVPLCGIFHIPHVPHFSYDLCIVWGPDKEFWWLIRSKLNLMLRFFLCWFLRLFCCAPWPIGRILVARSQMKLVDCQFQMKLICCVHATSSRSDLGQSESGRSHMHRVFRHPQKPGDSPVTGSLSGAGWFATRADAGSQCYRQPHGQQYMGGTHNGPP